MLKIFMVVFFTTLLVSCEKQGDSELLMDGKNSSLNLPEDLKGLKVYKVCVGLDEYIKVAVLNGEVKSVNELAGKTYRNTIILTKEESEERFFMIPIDKILLENDTVIMARKKPKSSME